MEKNSDTLGSRLREARKKKSLNQTEVGHFLNVSAASVSAYETGDANPAPNSLSILAEKLGITLDWLITGKEPVKPPQVDNGDLLLMAVDKSPVMDKWREKIKAEVREEVENYQSRARLVLSEEEQALVENYRFASDEIKEAAGEMLHKSAAKSRVIDGGGATLAG